jgi:DNA-directed RNA polymerase subunit F
MKLATIDVPPYEESYPYNVLYDILLIQEKMDYTCEEVSAKEELRKYDIVEFENYMLNRLSDRELRCIECKYRYGMTLEETGQKFSVTKERIRQILARAQRKLKYRLHVCYRVSKENYTRVKGELENTKNMYNKLLDYVMDIKNLTEDEITEVLERRVLSEALSDEHDISELELSVRAYNCLKRAGLTTVKEIIDIDDKSENSEWVFKIRNLGRKSAEEIKNKLDEKYNYTLKGWRKSDI